MTTTIRNYCLTMIACALTAGCGEGEVNNAGCGLLEAVTVLCLNTALTNAGLADPQPASNSNTGTDSSNGSGDTSTGSSPPADDTTSFRSVEVNRFDEYEPNNSLDNANPVELPTVSADVSAAFEIDGQLGVAEDDSDFFIFVAPRTDLYLVYLCEETCSEHPVDDEVYLMVYDQSQTTIASTPMGYPTEQFLAVELQAGLAYYVEINAYNTTDVYDYKLVVID